jgi:hypothetical protein
VQPDGVAGVVEHLPVVAGDVVEAVLLAPWVTVGVLVNPAGSSFSLIPVAAVAGVGRYSRSTPGVTARLRSWKSSTASASIQNPSASPGAGHGPSLSVDASATS